MMMMMMMTGSQKEEYRLTIVTQSSLYTPNHLGCRSPSTTPVAAPPRPCRSTRPWRGPPGGGEGGR
jgi:hypothetical protein